MGNAAPGMVTKRKGLFIIPPASIWGQLSNFFFLCSGFFSDLLLIRWMLVGGFGFLWIQGFLGFPGWNDVVWPPERGIAIDTVIWASVQLIAIHGRDVAMMYLDEQKPNLSQDQEKLWRYIYRQSGMSMKQFATLIVPTLSMVTLERGEYIPVKDYFYIILEGAVEAKVTWNSKNADSKFHVKMRSGEMFPIQHMYRSYGNRDSYFARQFMEPVAATATVRAFVIPVKTLNDIAGNPKSNDTWKRLLVATLAQIAECPYKDAFKPEDGEDFSLDKSHLRPTTVSSRHLNTGSIKGNAHVVGDDDDVICPMFEPLAPSEKPERLMAGSCELGPPVFGHFFHYAKMTFNIPLEGLLCGSWPEGLRHSLPAPQDPNRQDIDELIEDADESKLMSSRRKIQTTTSMRQFMASSTHSLRMEG